MYIDKLCADIESAYQKSISSHKTFHEMIRKLMKQQNWNSTIFYEKTELNKKIYSELKRPDYTPTMRIIVSICVGLKTDIHKADTLLAAAGLAFSPANRVHMAYPQVD